MVPFDDVVVSVRSLAELLKLLLPLV